jgi:hypothetical protein
VRLRHLQQVSVEKVVVLVLQVMLHDFQRIHYSFLAHFPVVMVVVWVVAFSVLVSSMKSFC